ncbi:MAG: signal transduction histidine kinase [Oceanicoccus sp.]
MLSLLNINSLIYLMVLFFSLIFFQNTANSEASLSEGQAKAALLYNFIKEIRWQTESVQEKFIIRFLGDDEEFQQEFLNIAKNEKIRGKQLQVIISEYLPESGEQNVLVLEQGLNDRLETIANSLVHTNTLLITDRASPSDRKSVMINFLFEDDLIDFEINRSNIVFEKLSISENILLYGGSEIEVATLYKEMDASLQRIKTEVRKHRSDLQANTENLRSIKKVLEEKTLEILQKDQSLDEKNQELSKQKTQLQRIQYLLSKNQLGLKNGERLLHLREAKVSALEEQISEKEVLLREHVKHLQKLQYMTEQKSLLVEVQEGTISSQRSVIVVVLATLGVFLVYIIYRQRQALTRERKLYEVESALVLAQAESIKMFESSLKLKNDFLTVTNHELRTPLNGILGALQVVDKESRVSLRSSVELIAQCTDDLAGLVNDILIYTEIQSDQLELQKNPTEISTYFGKLEDSYRRQCDKKSLRLDWSLDEEISSCLAFDRKKVTIVLEKLLNNAVEFTSRGKVSFQVRVERLDSGMFLKCAVSDTGPGFSMEAREHLFEAFWQNDSGLSRGHGGLGISLAICQRLIESMGGDIQVHSVIEGGSEVTFLIGVEEATLPVNRQIIPLDATPQILIVEDNIVNQMILKKMLRKLGYDSVLANDGVEALAVIAKSMPSLILMDLQMPNMDGFTCTEIIRKDYSVPIIAVSANQVTSQQRKCIEIGMNDYLGKPIELDSLASSIRNYLS